MQTWENTSLSSLCKSCQSRANQNACQGFFMRIGMEQHLHARGRSRDRKSKRMHTSFKCFSEDWKQSSTALKFEKEIIGQGINAITSLEIIFQSSMSSSSLPSESSSSSSSSSESSSSSISSSSSTSMSSSRVTSQSACCAPED